MAPAIIEIPMIPAAMAGASIRFMLETATNMAEARECYSLDSLK